MFENFRSVWDGMWDNIVDIADDIGWLMEETYSGAEDVAEGVICGVDDYILGQGRKRDKIFRCPIPDRF